MKHVSSLAPSSPDAEPQTSGESPEANDWPCPPTTLLTAPVEPSPARFSPPQERGETVESPPFAGRAHDRSGALKLAGPDALDEPSPPARPPSAVAVLNDVLTNKAAAAGDPLSRSGGHLVIDQHGAAHLVITGNGNPILLRVGSVELNAWLRKTLHAKGDQPTKAMLAELNALLYARAEIDGKRVNVWRRVGRRDDGAIVLALYDDTNTHVVISAGSVEVLSEGSNILFARAAHALPMAKPADGPGAYQLLRPYCNVDDVSWILFIGWVTYTLAHPKEAGSAFVVLVLLGGQGSGKSFMCKLIMQLIDASRVGVQVLPHNATDLAIAAQNAHLLAYDNVRGFTAAMSDNLCIAATGGAISKRQLYTDAEQHFLLLHCALLLNGISSFVEQPDLAQRSLPLRLRTMPEDSRQSESVMWQRFERDLPIISRGLFELIAQILLQLPAAEVTAPARMIDFSRWLAALERVHDAPVGVYQDQYVEALNEGQLDSILDNIVGSALLDSVDRLTEDGFAAWVGTPAELLSELERGMTIGKLRSRDWPSNPIALSKRLVPLQAALRTQGIEVDFRRGKQRQIAIRKLGGAE